MSIINVSNLNPWNVYETHRRPDQSNQRIGSDYQAFIKVLPFRIRAGTSSYPNVQNLFNVGDNNGPETKAEFEAKLDSLAAAINQAEPDVIGFQELGPESSLQALQARIKHTMKYRAIGIPDGRGIRVGYLATRKLNKVKTVPCSRLVCCPCRQAMTQLALTGLG